MVQRTPPPARTITHHPAAQGSMANNALATHQTSGGSPDQPSAPVDANLTALLHVPRGGTSVTGAETRTPGIFSQSTRDTAAGALLVAGLSAAAGAAAGALCYAVSILGTKLMGSQVLSEEQQQEATAMIHQAMGTAVPVIFLLAAALTAYKSVKHTDLESQGRALRLAGHPQMKILLDARDIVDTERLDLIDLIQERYQDVCERFKQLPSSKHRHYTRLEKQIRERRQTPVPPDGREEALQDVERLSREVDAMQARLARLQQPVAPQRANIGAPVLGYSLNETSDESLDETSDESAAAGAPFRLKKRNAAATTVQEPPAQPATAIDAATLALRAQQLQAVAAAINRARTHAPRGSDYISGKALEDFRNDMAQALGGRNTSHSKHSSQKGYAEQKTLRGLMTNVMKKYSDEQRKMVEDFLNGGDGSNRDLAR